MKTAEGCGHGSDAEYLRCLQHSRAVGVEVEYQMLFARDLQFLDASVYETLQGELGEVRRMLSGLTKTLHKGAV